MERPSVYIETSVVSYLTARASRDALRAEHQKLTREWWETQRQNFDLYISDPVDSEIAAGDRDAAALRVEVVKDLPRLTSDPGVYVLVERLMRETGLPEGALVDAIHIAFATWHGMDYLLTWNCTHIANPAFRRQIDNTCRNAGFQPATITTPFEMMKGLGDE